MQKKRKEARKKLKEKEKNNKKISSKHLVE